MGVISNILSKIMPNPRASKYALEEFENHIQFYELKNLVKIDRRVLEDFTKGKIGHDLIGIEKYVIEKYVIK